LLQNGFINIHGRRAVFLIIIETAQKHQRGQLLVILSRHQVLGQLNRLFDEAFFSKEIQAF
jgi:hypothetical protein